MTSVLVVEDEPQLLELLEFILRLHGFEVITATTGLEAMTLARRHSPDVVVSDVLGPPVSGLDLVRDLTVTMTGAAFVLLGAATAPANVAVLPKPFRPSDLVSLLDVMVAGPLP